MGLLIDLSSPKPFDPKAFDLEIKSVGFPTSIPDGSIGNVYHSKFIVIEDKMVLFSAKQLHLEGLKWIRELYKDVNLSGSIHCAGLIDVTLRRGGFGNNPPLERLLWSASQGFMETGMLSLEQSEQ